MESIINLGKGLLHTLDGKIIYYLEQCLLTENLVANPTSKRLTLLLLLIFFTIILYETFYWSGIYLGLWHYHAQDIFTEIPVHCAHVYIRLNVIKQENLSKLTNHYLIISKSYLLRNFHRYIRTPNLKLYTEFPKPITYHFEFSPDDFEMNDEPEWGSTVMHLRSKILQVFRASPLAIQYLDVELTASDSLVILNNRFQILKAPESDDLYLCKVNIETGDTINCFVVVP